MTDPENVRRYKKTIKNVADGLPSAAHMIYHDKGTFKHTHIS